MNDTTFSGNGKVSFIPVITSANPKPITNADRIRAMTDEELAEFLKWVDFGRNYPGDKSWFDWLKSPVEVDNG